MFICNRLVVAFYKNKNMRYLNTVYFSLLILFIYIIFIYYKSN